MSKRIFVVEDDHACETVLRRVIRSIDPEASVSWMESAEEAIETLAKEKSAGRSYDLIIADIFLSGKTTGIELWDACKDYLPNTPVLITSSLSVNRFFDTIGKDAIAPPYLCKPFYIGECKQMIEGLLN